jgi:hypothetical protein
VEENHLVKELDPKLAERYALPLTEVLYIGRKPKTPLT